MTPPPLPLSAADLDVLRRYAEPWVETDVDGHIGALILRLLTEHASLTERATAAEADLAESLAALAETRGKLEAATIREEELREAFRRALAERDDERERVDTYDAMCAEQTSRAEAAETALRQAQAERDALREREARLVAAVRPLVDAIHDFDGATYDDFRQRCTDAALRAISAARDAMTSLGHAEWVDGRDFTWTPTPTPTTREEADRG